MVLGRRFLDDGIGLLIGQFPKLGLADAVVAQAFHDVAYFRRGSRSAVGSAQCAGSGRRCRPGDVLAFVADLDPAVGVFQDFHLDASIAWTLGAGQPLQGAPLALDRVVPGHLARVLEAEDLIQRLLGYPGAVCRHGQLGRYDKLGVVAGQEVLQDSVGLVDGPGSAETQFGHQPVLEGFGSAFQTSLGLGPAGEYLLDAQFGDGFAEVGGLHRRRDVLGLPESLNTP